MAKRTLPPAAAGAGTMSNIRALLLLLLGVALVLAVDELWLQKYEKTPHVYRQVVVREPIQAPLAWSPTVNGVRARLLVSLPQKKEEPFYRVYIEFENQSDVVDSKIIRFSLEKLILRVTDKSGKELPHGGGPYDGFASSWEPLVLPYGGTLRFLISSRGAGYRPGDKGIVDIGPFNLWVIPPDVAAYYLSGSLAIQKEKSDSDWCGTLELPKVEIPKVK